MSGMFTSKQSSETIPYPKFAQGFFRDELLPYTQRLLGNYDSQGGTLGRKGRDYIDTVLSGDTYVPSGELENMLSTSRANFNQTVDKGINQANAAASRAGMLASGAANRLRTKAATDAANQWAEREAGVRYSDLNDWRNRRASAAEQGLAVGQQDLNQLLQFINMFRGGGTTTGTSTMPMIQGIAQLGQGLGGLRTR